MACITQTGSENSTNVRHAEGVGPIGRILGALHAHAVQSAAEYAAREFLVPTRVVPPPMLAEPAGGSQPLAVPGWPVHLNARSWGEAGAPSVLLLHGWSGQQRDMYALVEPLLAKGFRVVAFDAPGHGRSAGEETSVPEMGRALRAVADAAGPVHAVVAHSMGAVALMLALKDGLSAGRVALVGLPADPVRYAAKAAAAHKLDAVERGEMFAILERRSAPFVDLSLSALGAGMTIPALLVHSTDDRVAPVSASLETAAAWRGSRVHLAEGLGHRRILDDAAVAAEITAFVAASRTGGSANGGLERASIDRPARIG